MAREVYWLQGRKHGGWELIGSGVGTRVPMGLHRRDAEVRARAFCRSRHFARQVLVQLKVKNKTNGRISFEATYGADPRRYRG